MSKNTGQKKTSATNADGVAATAGSSPFEGELIRIQGNRLEMESDSARKTSYALASDATLTCDGKAGKEESLTAGRRIRATTQTGNSHMVTGIEWPKNNRTFPPLKTVSAK